MRTKSAALIALAAVSLVVTACSSAADDASAMTTSSPAPSTTFSAPPLTSVSVAPNTSLVTSTSTTPTSTVSTSTAGPTDPLTGLSVTNNPVIAVKIDNTVFPQWGITDADIIYSEQVEGGLTRLIAIYHRTLPKEVGAVRSIRSTDMQLLPSYGDILFVSSGGARANLSRLRQSDLVGVMFDAGDPGLWRSAVKYAPYNVHANLQSIAKGHPDAPGAQPVGFTFNADDARVADARSVATVDVTMLAMRFTFSYQDGRYLPHHDGTAYVDEAGKKVYVDNVIVQHVVDHPDGIIDPAGNPSFMTTTTGTGEFTLYRDGIAIDGTWSRDSKTDPTTFLDEGGEPVTLAPGKTWVLLAPQTSTFGAG